MNKFGIQGFDSAEAAKSDSEISFPHGDVVILKYQGIRVNYVWVAPSQYAEELIQGNSNITEVT